MINWKKPDLQEEIEEIERTAVDLDIDASKLFEDAKKGKIIDLSDDIWSKLDNTDSWDIKSIEDARVLADEYDKDIESLIRGFESGKASIPAPIVLKRQEGGYYLIAGNTRLMVARAFGMIPKIYLVEDNQLRLPMHFFDIDLIQHHLIAHFLRRVYEDLTKYELRLIFLLHWDLLLLVAFHFVYAY